MRSRSRRGNYLVLTALGLPVFFSFVAISLDMARITNAKADLSRVSQASAHFAILSLKDNVGVPTIQDQLRQFYPENTIDTDRAQEQNVTVRPGFWDFENNEWTPYEWDAVGNQTVNAFEASAHRIGARDGLPMMLAPFLGVNYVDIMTERSTIAAIRTTEMMIVLDTTFSFRGEIGVAKEASLAILESMRDQDRPGNRIGMVTFTGGAELFTSFKDPTTQFSDLYARWSGDYLDAPVIPDTDCVPHYDRDGHRVVGSWRCTGPQFDNSGHHAGTASDPVPVIETTYLYKRGISLCNNRDLAYDPTGYDVHGRIFTEFDNLSNHQFLSVDMVPCGKGGGGTNQGSGLEVALDEMLIRGAPGSKWEMMLITDGQPWAPYDLTHHTHPRWPNGGHGTGPHEIRQYTREIAQEICDKEIDLHAIYYATNLNQDFQTFLRTQVVCDNETSTYSGTPNIEELEPLMDEIVQLGPIVFVQ